MCYTDAVAARQRLAKEDAELRNRKLQEKREGNVITKAEVRERVEQGEILVLIEGKVYDLTKFVKFHPGGELAIWHMRGRDATDAVLAYHPASTIKQRMPHFVIGSLPKSELTVDPISEEYKELDAKLKADGFYETNYWFYVREFFKLMTLWGVMIGAVVWGQSGGWYILSAVCAATLWHQAAFIAHDAGHSGITHSSIVDMRLGICLGNFLGGLSLGWWKHNHNVHHIVTNSVTNDPDIQHLPFMAISTKFFKSLYSTYYNRVLTFDPAAQFFVSVQHYMFYVVLCFGRFNLYVLSWTHVFSKRCHQHRILEIVCMSLFWTWFLPLMSAIPSWKWRVAYIMLSHCLTVFLHLQITLSHFGMDHELWDEEVEEQTADGDVGSAKRKREISFAEMGLRTTMDVECPTWMDWFHGGLQFQVEHHLFPRLPRHNLRFTRPLVLAFAKKHNLPFHSYGFVRSNILVLDVLKSVAHQVKSVIRVDPKEAWEHLSG
ncbi:fatty acid desaturase-domain-containing protein [Gaertneriomyces semiglobifer]|nr:fatty acid desaturase-domain-containing protein [Gaertneriomyces semiglobifer]